jgi:hypothetical protein
MVGSEQHAHGACHLFQEEEKHFELSKLIEEVRASKYVMVFLSQHCASSPYCLVELCSAVAAGARIISVIVHRPGLELFNFDAMNKVLSQPDISSLMNAEGWAVLKQNEISQEVVRAALKKVMNVKAFDLHTNTTQRVIQAEMEDIWDGMVE